MRTVRKVFSFLCDVFFPQEIRISIFNDMEISTLEKLAVRISVPSPHQCIAPFPYKNKRIKDAIRAMKYYGHKRASYLLGTILYPYLAEELSEKRMFGIFLEPILIPIPLHSTRLHERGFNQTERIAVALLSHCNEEAIVLRTDILFRKKNTRTQTKQETKKERFGNMKDAFYVSNPHYIIGKDIILLDDVVTTGATLASAKKTLQNAGARNVLCIAVAH
jgi:ComF family protein